MGPTEATKKSDLITFPRSESILVQQLAALPTVINLLAIGFPTANNSNEEGWFPGLQDTYGSLFADGSDLGYIAGSTLGAVTGSVSNIAVTAGGSGYTSAPTVAFTASSMVGSIVVTAGGSGYTAPPILTFSGGGGSGALAVGVINPAGQLVGALVACSGWGYTSAPTITVASSNGAGSGATATAVLATPVAMATVVAGAVTAVTIINANPSLPGGNVWNAGAGYTSAPAVTFSGGGGTGATATASIINGAPNLSAYGVGAGIAGTFPGGCARLPNGQGHDAFARANKDTLLGVIAATSGGIVRFFRSSY